MQSQREVLDLATCVQSIRGVAGHAEHSQKVRVFELGNRVCRNRGVWMLVSIIQTERHCITVGRNQQLILSDGFSHCHGHAGKQHLRLVGSPLFSYSLALGA